jgi:hypothetical protein
MAKRVILGVLLAVMAVSGLVAVWLLRGEDGSTRAEGGAVEIGIDPEVTGNTATTLGTLEYCVRVDIASPAFDNVSDYNIDVYVQGDTLAPVAYDAWVTYDATKVHIAAPGTNTLIKLPGASSFSDAVPDADGKYVASVAYLSGGPGTAGDGTLVRLGLDIGASGLVAFDFDTPGSATGYYTPGADPAEPTAHPVTRMTALLAINEDCPRGGRPEPSPTPEGGRQQATPTPISRAELERLRLEDAAKPKFEGVLSGIHIYPTSFDAPQRKWACSDAKPDEVQHVSLDAVAGTPMDIVPTYLPPGAEELSTTLPPAICKGTVAYVEREWTIQPGGGDVFIARRQGERAIDWDAPVERIEATTVAGKPAVLVKPLLERDDYAGVIMVEDFGITVVRVFGLPFDETLKIAEGVK